MIWRTLGALLAGLSVAGAFPPVGLVVLAPAGVAGLVLTTRGLSMARGFVPGLAFGVGFQFAVLSWMTAVGPDAWAALAALEASFFGVLGAALAALGRLPGWPVWSAAAWVAVEAWKGVAPLSGMPFGRLAYATADTPYSAALPYVGSNGVSFLLALTGALLAWLLVAGRTRRVAAVVAVAALATAVAAPVWAPYRVSQPATVPVAVVQGNVPGDGTDILLDHRQVTANHVEATVDLAADVRAGREPEPAFVLWPENSAAVDPVVDDEVRTGIERAVAAVGVPIVVGAPVNGPTADTVLNQGIVWSPETGPGERYSKLHPVPFGEYIPWRDVVFSSNFGQLRLIPRDMLPGELSDPLSVAGVELADSICFDIAYDDGIYHQVREGAEMLVVQTSNAMFINTAQVEQQFEITRLRALETGRHTVVASTNGVTGVIGPDGEVVERVPLRTTAVVVTDVGLSDAVPPSVVVGPWVSRVAALVAVGGVMVALVLARRRRPSAVLPAGGGSGGPAEPSPATTPGSSGSVPSGERVP